MNSTTISAYTRSEGKVLGNRPISVSVRIELNPAVANSLSDLKSSNFLYNIKQVYLYMIGDTPY